MTKLKEIYKCEICGNIIEVVHEGVGKLVCCNQEMELLAEKKEDVGTEKHLPVVTFHEDKIIVNNGFKNDRWINATFKLIQNSEHIHSYLLKIKLMEI